MAQDEAKSAATEGEDVEEQEVKQKGEVAKKEASQLDSITDIVQEKELNQAKVDQAMKDIAEMEGAEEEAKKQRERELAAVSVKDEDVALLQKEFDLEKNAADRALREAGGDAMKAISSLMQQ